jgi:hypothetical protein
MMAQEGVTKSNGDMLMRPEEIGAAAIFFQGLGFQPSEVKDRRDNYYRRVQFEEYYKERVTELKRGWVQAKKSGDTAELRDLEAQWRKMNEAKERVGLKPSPLSNLLTADREQQKRQQKLDQDLATFR